MAWATRARRPDANPTTGSQASITDSFVYLTPEELTGVMEEIAAIYRRFDVRRDQDKRPGDALPVQLYAHGHPLPLTTSGN